MNILEVQKVALGHVPVLESEGKLRPSASVQSTGVEQPAEDYLDESEDRLIHSQFHKVVSVLNKPRFLARDSSTSHEFSYFFKLDDEQRNEYRKPKTEIQLRIWKFNCSRSHSDCFPPELKLTVNHKIVELPSTPGPIKIIAHTNCQNSVQGTWTSNHIRREYAFAVYMVRRMTVDDMIRSIKSKGYLPKDQTREIVKKSIETSDHEISIMKNQVSLRCTITFKLISSPCRAVTCTHPECFDLEAFLCLEESKEKLSEFQCPVCKSTVELKNLWVDEIFTEIIKEQKKRPDAGDQVDIFPDGGWKIVEKPMDRPDAGDQVEISSLGR